MRLPAGFGVAHLERHTLHYRHDERSEPVVVAGGLARDPADGGHVGGFEDAAKGVSEQIPGEALNENVAAGQNRRAQGAGAIQRRAVCEAAGSGDADAVVFGAPGAGGVEIFESETLRIEALVAGVAGFLGAVGFHGFAD